MDQQLALPEWIKFLTSKKFVLLDSNRTAPRGLSLVVEKTKNSRIILTYASFLNPHFSIVKKNNCDVTLFLC